MAPPSDDTFDRFFGLLRDDLATFRREVNERLDKLVSADAFAAEQRRVDERIKVVDDKLNAEVEARKAAMAAEEAARKLMAAELEKKNARTGSWIRWTIGTLLGLGGAGGIVGGIAALLGVKP
ncbi:hypothetical protein [Pseudolysinimonas sp.]|uniref:hypothetical protein n=1 Tax=Pseudolysinimonas sp. TaxID=2680009 RepID=UPI003F811500